MGSRLSPVNQSKGAWITYTVLVQGSRCCISMGRRPFSLMVVEECCNSYSQGRGTRCGNFFSVYIQGI